ncbi:helix-turn-helix domain-containing protein [Nonomuraea fuscirosea]|uniref:helix-turn-helix domain-containing protein n=1 Tax=Nonomuraea fuscirosea TaxID=1291556 RepID=UPI0033CA07D1
MDGRRQLGEFLRTRRAQVSPEELGVRTYGDQRRVPGLRREELALLAGVSASYYARLEQGLSVNASPQVLEAIATALRLNEAERRHLHRLAAGSQGRPAGRRAAPERAGEAARQLMRTLADVPAVMLGRSSDVLAWSPAGHALFAGHLDPDGPDRPGRRPNMARLVFLDEHTRELYEDWPAKARTVVGTLRAASGRFPHDPAIAALVGELSVHSSEFARLWAGHRVKSGDSEVYRMRHPLVGAMTVTQQALRTESGQVVVIATTEAGSPSQAAMTLLAHTAATQRHGAQAPAEQPRLPALPE